jgi:hypothetical protein
MQSSISEMSLEASFAFGTKDETRSPRDRAQQYFRAIEHTRGHQVDPDPELARESPGDRLQDQFVPAAVTRILPTE